MSIPDTYSWREIVIYSAPDEGIKTAEFTETATCAKFTQVRQEGARIVSRELLGYNRGQA